MSARIAPPAGTPYLVAVVAGAMAFLAVCALGAAYGVTQLAGFWDADLTGSATLRLPAEGDAAAAMAALEALPGIAALRLLPEAEVAALLAPWLGEVAGLEGLGLPQIVAVRLGETPPSVEAVQAVLATAAPEAVYDDHRAWAAPLLRRVAAVQHLMLGAVGLMALALAAMVVVAARASLAGAATTVRTLRLLGARDGFIAAAFDRGIALRAFLGAAFGAPVAAILLFGVATPGLPPLEDPWPLAVLAALPVALAVLAWVTARLAILVMLRQTR